MKNNIDFFKQAALPYKQSWIGGNDHDSSAEGGENKETHGVLVPLTVGSILVTSVVLYLFNGPPDDPNSKCTFFDFFSSGADAINHCQSLASKTGETISIQNGGLMQFVAAEPVIAGIILTIGVLAALIALFGAGVIGSRQKENALIGQDQHAQFKL